MNLSQIAIYKNDVRSWLHAAFQCMVYFFFLSRPHVGPLSVSDKPQIKAFLLQDVERHD